MELIENDLLFVYGTLLLTDNEFGSYLKANSRFFANGKIKGKLYDAGDYPAAVITADSEGYIFGRIVTMKNSAAVLRQLDIYEDFGPDESQPNEFIRALKPVETDEGRFKCWVYVYNLPVEGLPLIPSGKYLSAFI